MDYFVFGEVDSRNHNVWIYPSDIDSAPQREYSEVVIAGRNGTLTIDNGRYENIDHVYQGIIFSDNVETDLINFRNAMVSQIDYQRLEDSIHTDEFYEARFMEIFAPVIVEGRGAAKFEIKFNRKPQRFLVSGETIITVSSNTSITNETKFDARPLLEVTGYGNLGIGDDTITIGGTSTSQVTFIDCDIMEAYSKSGSVITSKNSQITLSGNDYPTLKVGANGITLASTMSRVKITPRWYRL